MEHKVILQITVLLLVDFLTSFPGLILHVDKRNKFFLVTTALGKI